MRKYILSVLLLGGLAGPGFGREDAAEILERVDRNMSSETSIIESSMIIHTRRGSRTITSRSYVQGADLAFTEYLSPPREAGTKMLKQGDQLWIYTPSTDRMVRLSGHMLRQSVMGSDLSYEDMMEDRRLSEMYTAEWEGEDTLDDRRVHVLYLTAKTDDVAYASRRIWIDAERHVPLKEDLFARGGQRLKQTVYSEVKKIEGRWFPTAVRFRDMLKEGDGTDFRMTSIVFDEPIPPHVFSRAALRR